ncbi:MAG TPA: MmcQ/YjbR family DNA-binding protein [Candidatus Sulfotelmatobacter sp.]|nr:MmcQ/YjbR family DNA-binding protein [Candidatus Sulfotelmatobacter sp.]
MNVDEIREYCLAFPAATEKLQWDDALCFKISGKIFTILGLDNLRLCFKCTPETFAELIERDDIRPAPYVGRYKWVMLDRLDALAREELKQFIRQSYDMIAAKAAGKSDSSRTRNTSRRKVAKSTKSTFRPRKG